MKLTKMVVGPFQCYRNGRIATVRTDGHLDEYDRFRIGRNPSQPDGAVTKPGLKRFAGFLFETSFLTGKKLGP